jgi:sugar (pentulose or hexulose) kinase
MDAGNRHLYITGGFTRNRIFTKAMALLLDGKEDYTSEIDNATSLGAAMLMNTGHHTKFRITLQKI